MQNDAGEYVDLYVPRKCSTSNRIIHAKDHASIQINVAEVSLSYACYATLILVIDGFHELNWPKFECIKVYFH